MSYQYFIFVILGAYLVGSIPFGLIIAKVHGKDIREIGSGNIGATNLSRALGRRWGCFCFLLDVSKGLLPMVLSGKILSGQVSVGMLFLWLLVGFAAVLGHIFPLYLGFKGGKGVATSFGVALGLWPYYTICAGAAIAAWGLVVLVTRYISLASMVASVVFPVVLVGLIAVKEDWEFVELWPLLTAATVIPLMVILRHRGNIKRLMQGTESKIFSK